MSSTPLATALVVPFEQLRMTDVEAVGGKNASLGEMISQLAASGVRVPGGFATTAHAFREFLQHERAGPAHRDRLATLNTDDVRALAEAGAQIRQWIIDTPFPADLDAAIRAAVQPADRDNPGRQLRGALVGHRRRPARRLVRRPAGDLPERGGIDDVLHRMKEVFASLYNDRAISYRVHKGFAHGDVALSAGVQRMVRSDLGAAGVMFTIDTESASRTWSSSPASYGLGETVVQGAVNPDEFYVHKPTLAAGKLPVIRRALGSKLQRMEFATPEEKAATGKLVRTVDTPPEQRNRYSLTDADVIELARYAVIIEQHYGRPMDIEWGKDGARRQALHPAGPPRDGEEPGRGQGRAALQAQGHGTCWPRAAPSARRSAPARCGWCARCPRWTGAARRRAGHRHDRPQLGAGDEARQRHRHQPRRAHLPRGHHRARTGHPGGGGLRRRHRALQDGALVTVACSEGDTGYIFDGLLETEVTEVQRGEMPYCPIKIMMNVGNPQLAFDFAQMPNSGVGLARLEFIINNNIGVHPKAILDYPNIDPELKKAVESVARGHASPRAFYVDKLAEGIATIAAAFWPKPVIVRLSDFKSNEYRKLIGGTRYEPDEENPMLGFRGASRYISGEFSDAFAMECEALKRVRNDMGLTNVEIMVPFVRTVRQAERVVQMLAERGLQRGVNGLR
jgi:pyruvate,water dikinase